MRDFRVTVGAPWHDRVVHFLSQKLEAHENVPHDHARLRMGHVREQEWPNDIAHGVNVPLRCLQIVGDAHTPLVDVNARRFQIETLQVWASPDGDKQRVCKESPFSHLARLSI